jgi:hypothetical protein
MPERCRQASFLLRAAVVSAALLCGCAATAVHGQQQRPELWSVDPEGESN